MKPKKCPKTGKILKTYDHPFFGGFERKTKEECWPWIRARNRLGYGLLRVGKKSDTAYRVSWMIFNEDFIPKGKLIRHLCNNPSCVNPHHLKLGTYKENWEDRRSSTYTPITHCKRGHEFTPENTRIAKLTNEYTARACRKCACIKADRYRQKMKAQGINIKQRDRERAAAKALKEMSKV